MDPTSLRSTAWSSLRLVQLRLAELRGRRAAVAVVDCEEAPPASRLRFGQRGEEGAKESGERSFGESRSDVVVAFRWGGQKDVR